MGTKTGRVCRYFFLIFLLFFITVFSAWAISFSEGYIEADWNTLSFEDTNTWQEVPLQPQTPLAPLRLDWATPPGDGGWNTATATYEFSAPDQMMLQTGININFQVDMAADEPGSSSHTDLIASMELYNLTSGQSDGLQFANDWHLYAENNEGEYHFNAFYSLFASTNFNAGDKGKLILTLNNFSDVLPHTTPTSVPEPATALLFISLLLTLPVMKKTIK